ncbi:MULTISPECIES: RagB/SusD family nutrient uptake outer membrane protein [Chitinophagaceae]
MKKKFLIITAIAFFAACKKDYLDKYPLTSPTEETAFVSYDNFKSYVYPCYGMFTDNTILTSVTSGFSQDAQYRGDYYANYLTNKGTSSQNPYAWQTVAESVSGNGWDFTYIRRINILLNHINDGTLTDAERNHWKAVGYFFHAYWYMMLINRFGDVPWVNTVLGTSSEDAYGPRVSHTIVADSVLARLKWAEENIGDFSDEDGANTINKNCVLAAMSRFTLREATWRKYHQLGDYANYLSECARVSKLLIDQYPTLYTGTDGQPAAGYGEMWTTESLSNVPGVILYKEFFSNTNYYCNSSYIEHTSSHNIEMPQHTVDMYLTKDGLPIKNASNTLYNGDKDMYSTFRNRDPRLYHTVIPPFNVSATAGSYATWSYTSNSADREYIDMMKPNTSCSNPGIGMKRLPAQNWSASLVPSIPNFTDGKAATTKAYVSCRSGYYVWKCYDQWETNSNANALNTSDKPIFKIEEILLNYAECMWEQGSFSQAVADLTINKLRARAGVGNMVVANINANFDPARDQTVDPVLWEIRRERIIELMGEGFGFDDIRRWKKAPWYINKQDYGMWIKKADISGSLLNMTTGYADNTGMTEGYRYLYNDPVKDGKGWLDKYYLYEVPTNEIALNPQLTQNEGW